MNLGNTTWFQRMVGGVAMIVAPIVFVIAELLHGHFERDAAKQLDVIAQNTDRWYAAHILVLAGLMLALPAFAGLAHLVRQGRPALANLGQVLLVSGTIALAALVGMELVAWQMAQSGFNRAEMILLWEKTAENAGIAPLVLAAVLFPVAWLLLGLALFLARLAPTWIAALVGFAQLVGFASELSGGPKWLAVAAQIAFAIGLIPLGIRAVRQRDAVWAASELGIPGAPA